MFNEAPHPSYVLVALCCAIGLVAGSVEIGLLVGLAILYLPRLVIVYRHYRFQHNLSKLRGR